MASLDWRLLGDIYAAAEDAVRIASADNIGFWSPAGRLVYASSVWLSQDCGAMIAQRAMIVAREIPILQVVQTCVGK